LTIAAMPNQMPGKTFLPDKFPTLFTWRLWRIYLWRGV